MEISRITTKGQVTLSAALRRRAGIKAGGPVAMVASKNGILIKPVCNDELTEEQDWLRRLDIATSQVARGETTFHASTEEFFKHLEKIGGSE